LKSNEKDKKLSENYNMWQMALRLRSIGFAKGLRSEIREPPTHKKIKSSSGMKSAGLREVKMLFDCGPLASLRTSAQRFGNRNPIPLLQNPFLDTNQFMMYNR